MMRILAAALQPLPLVLVFLVSSMAAIGLGLTLPQITAPLRNAKLVVLALLANFIIAPMLATGIARLLHLEEPFAIGLILPPCFSPS